MMGLENLGFRDVGREQLKALVDTFLDQMRPLVDMGGTAQLCDILPG